MNKDAPPSADDGSTPTNDAPAALNPTKTMSRASLYTSMAAYNNTSRSSNKNQDPQAYIIKQQQQQRSTPKSVQESSLSDFLQTVSVDYHANSKPFHSRNSANRPLTTNEVSKGLSQRALTLVGGGINNGRNKKKKVKKEAPEGLSAKQPKNSKQHKKRTDPATSSATTKKNQQEPDHLPSSSSLKAIDRRRKKGRGGELDSTAAVCSVVQAANAAWATTHQQKQQSSAAASRQWNYIHKLNAQWNEYAWNLIDTFSQGDAQQGAARDASSSSPTSRLRKLAPNMEFIGARVRVYKCRQHPEYLGRHGILVMETAQTWSLVIQNKQTGNVTSPSAATPKKESSNNKATPLWTDLLVPKKDSSLAVILPCREQDSVSVLLNRSASSSSSWDDTNGNTSNSTLPCLLGSSYNRINYEA